MDLMIFSASFAVLAFLAFIAFRSLQPRLGLGAGLLFAIYVGLDDLATVLPGLLPALDLIEGSMWNWDGKLWSIVLALGTILLLRLDRTEVGLIAPKNLKVSMLVMTLLVALSFSLGLVFQPEVPSLETVAFQLLMPGLAEELTWRGVAPAILLGLFRPGRTWPRHDSNRIPWNVILITSIMFGILHGLSYADGSFSFSPLPALFPFVGSLAYGWLRFYSGSLLFPVLAHGLGNALFLAPSVL